MPSYTFQFAHNVNDYVFDLITHQEVRVVGVFYQNGKISDNGLLLFHEDIYIVEFLNGKTDKRYEEELQIL